MKDILLIARTIHYLSITAMHKLVLIIIGVWGISRAGCAQRPVTALPDTLEPIYLLNSTTVVNGVVADFDPADIQQILVYKPSLRTATDSVPPWQTTMGTGVIMLKSKRRIPSEPLRAFGQRLNLTEPLHFALNGHRLSTEAAAKLRIASAAVAQLHVSYPTADQPVTIVDIWLKQMPRKDHPPGTILIR
ncbi:hypothetical protein [Hymenobacter sp. 102]|uniref:hypothetical protein n=1 Tax=Hymenobacter sp. 102 TaxID=3403152 RepID=UPI003CF4851D